MIPVRAYAQLVRLPNVFTALADICLGVAVTSTVDGVLSALDWLHYGFLLASSACLYCGGMVWNDVFDLEQDRRERPFRPIPSGRISRLAAARFGASLLAAGVIFACVAGWRPKEMNWTPAVIGIGLVLAIFLYDGWLKKFWVGPLGMGACRFLNVLLGLSCSVGVGSTTRCYLAAVVGVYIVGVTWFARKEAQTSTQVGLAGGCALMLTGLILALPARVLADTQPVQAPSLYLYLLVGLAFWVGMPVYQAVLRPSPQLVQAAVKRAILGLIVLDVALATALAGIVGLGIVMLLIPSLYLGRWLYST